MGIIWPESNTDRLLVENEWDFAFTESKSEVPGLIYTSQRPEDEYIKWAVKIGTARPCGSQPLESSLCDVSGF
jgi:hypothetical protein